MRTDTRFLCNLSLISDCNGIALRRKNFFFERQQQHAHVLQKCTFFVDLSKGAEVRLQVCRLLRFLDSAVNGTSLQQLWSQIFMWNIFAHISHVWRFGDFEDAARLTVVPGKQYGQLLLHSFFLPHWKTSKCFRICCWNFNFSTHIAYGVPKFYQTCFCCHDYHNILTS